MKITIKGSLIKKGDEVVKAGSPPWTWGVFRTDDREKVHISGNLVVDMAEGLYYEVTGKKKIWKDKPSIDVTGMKGSIPANRIGVSSYIAKNYTGIGPKKTEHIFRILEEKNTSIESFSDMLLNDPLGFEDFIISNKISSKVEFKDQYEPDPEKDEEHNRLMSEVHKAKRYLFIYFHQYGLALNTCYQIALITSKAETKSIHANPFFAYPNFQMTYLDIIERFKSNPYFYIIAVSHYGFQTADSIALANGFNPESPDRVNAYVYDLIGKRTAFSGATYVHEGRLFNDTRRFFPGLDDSQVLDSLKKGHWPLIDDNKRLYHKEQWSYEETISELISRNVKAAPDSYFPLRPIHNVSRFTVLDYISTLEKEKGFSLDGKQKDALMGILFSTSQLHVITGMPGCGKTAIMEFFAYICNKMHKKVAFLTPIGKAAKVLNTRIGNYGYKASTIHSHTKNGTEAIKEGIVVLDEAGMVDNEWAAKVIRKMNPDAHLIVIGDPNQLLSVAPGNFLKDILSFGIEHYHLETIHRNDGNILKLVNEVKEGSISKYRTDDIQMFGIPSLGKIDDFIDYYLGKAEKYGLANSAIICARRKGMKTIPDWNTTYLNSRIQDRINPSGERLPGTDIRQGDRLIIRKNNHFTAFKVEDGVTSDVRHEMYVCNGDTGRLTGFELSAGVVKNCVIELDSGDTYSFPPEICETLDLGYTITVHSAQGSEYQYVVFVNDQPGSAFLCRELLFTALSRCKKYLEVFCNLACLKGIAAMKAPLRPSTVVEKTRIMLGLEIPAGDTQAPFETDGGMGDLLDDDSVHIAKAEAARKVSGGRPVFF